MNSHPDYSGRADFLADAVEAFLAEAGPPAGLQVSLPRAGAVEDVVPGAVAVEPVVEVRSYSAARTPQRLPVAVDVPEPIAPVLASTLLAVADVRAGTAVAPATVAPTAPMWGMHNRDFPTIWVAGLLAQAVHRSGPQLFTGFVLDAIRTSWQVARGLDGDRSVDLSGFPSNVSKASASEGRFRNFFIGSAPGFGPVFDLGLAGVDDDTRIAPTAEGLVVLQQLAGLRPTAGAHPPQASCVAWLCHLARRAPADWAEVRWVATAVSDGMTSREALVAAMGERHPAWSPTECSTNTAGFVARAREWGLLRHKQLDGRYVPTAHALSLVDEIDAASGVGSEFVRSDVS